MNRDKLSNEELKNIIQVVNGRACEGYSAEANMSIDNHREYTAKVLDSFEYDKIIQNIAYMQD